MDSRDTTSPDGASIRYWSTAGRCSHPVVLVHGWACSSQFWKFQVDALTRRHDVVLVDLAGHGESSAGERDWTMEEFADDVLAVLDAVGAEQWVVAGHSMGGAVAVELARLEPARTQAVIGVDSFTYDGFYRRRPDAKIERIVEPYKADFPVAVHKAMSGLFLPDADPDLKRWICESMASSDKASALASLIGLLRWDVDAALQSASVPVICIAAAEFLNAATAARLRPSLEIEEMQNVGHFLMLEDPRDFNDRLLSLATQYLATG